MNGMLDRPIITLYNSLYFNLFLHHFEQLMGPELLTLFGV